MVTTMSALPNEAGDEAAVTPGCSAAKRSWTAGALSRTISPNPAACRFRAMGRPMLPSPTNPTTRCSPGVLMPCLLVPPRLLARPGWPGCLDSDPGPAPWPASRQPRRVFPARRRPPADAPHEVADERRAVPGEDGLRVELDALDRVADVPQPHRQPAGSCCYLQLGRQRAFVDDKRVIPGCLERVRQAGEHAAAVVGDLGWLAVHGTGRPDDGRAERRRDRLMAQADAKQRDRPGAEADHLDADPGLGGGARARGDHHAGGIRADDLGGGQLVVADHLDPASGGGEQVSEVVGERVVVVDDDDERTAGAGHGSATR